MSVAGEPSNERRMAYGRAATRDFREVSNDLDVVEEFTGGTSWR
jgi:hypothetical protein